MAAAKLVAAKSTHAGRQPIQEWHRPTVLGGIAPTGREFLGFNASGEVCQNQRVRARRCASFAAFLPENKQCTWTTTILPGGLEAGFAFAAILALHA